LKNKQKGILEEDRRNIIIIINEMKKKALQNKVVF